MATMTRRIGDTLEELVPEVAALRHELHQHPEIRYEEHWTSDRIARFLEETGIPFRRGYAKGTGIVATIEGGEGPVVALRADMDALEIQEETGLPYASRTPNRMHACGHDGHTATLCGVAKALWRHRAELRGTVRLLFQPAEEMAAGGRLMAEEGAVDGVGAVFGLHGWPALPVGHVILRPGCLMAGAQDFRIDVRGKGCHGADPGSGVDPIVVAAHIITALQTIVSRELNPWEAGVATVGLVEAGRATNIIPDTAVMRGTLRSLSVEGLERIAGSIRRIAEHTARALRAEAQVTFPHEAYPPLYNDPAMTEFMRRVVVDTLGPERALSLDAPAMVAEDFAFYLQRVPGTFVYVGVNPDPDRPYPPLHSSRYNFSDEALLPAMTVLASAAERYLNQGSEV